MASTEGDDATSEATEALTLLAVISLSLVFAAMPLMGSSIGWLYLFFTLLPIASMGTMQVTWTHLVNLWFERNRGLSLALVLSGTGLAAALIPSAITWSVTVCRVSSSCEESA